MFSFDNEYTIRCVLLKHCAKLGYSGKSKLSGTKLHIFVSRITKQTQYLSSDITDSLTLERNEQVLNVAYSYDHTGKKNGTFTNVSYNFTSCFLFGILVR